MTPPPSKKRKITSRHRSTLIDAGTQATSSTMPPSEQSSTVPISHRTRSGVRSGVPNPRASQTRSRPRDTAEPPRLMGTSSAESPLRMAPEKRPRFSNLEEIQHSPKHELVLAEPDALFWGDLPPLSPRSLVDVRARAPLPFPNLGGTRSPSIFGFGPPEQRRPSLPRFFRSSRPFPDLGGTRSPPRFGFESSGQMGSSSADPSRCMVPERQREFINPEVTMNWPRSQTAAKSPIPMGSSSANPLLRRSPEAPSLGMTLNQSTFSVEPPEQTGPSPSVPTSNPARTLDLRRLGASGFRIMRHAIHAHTPPWPSGNPTLSLHIHFSASDFPPDIYQAFFRIAHSVLLLGYDGIWRHREPNTISPYTNTLTPISPHVALYESLVVVILTIVATIRNCPSITFAGLQSHFGIRDGLDPFCEAEAQGFQAIIRRFFSRNDIGLWQPMEFTRNLFYHDGARRHLFKQMVGDLDSSTASPSI